MATRLVKLARGRPRRHPEPVMGDLFGVWRVVAVLGRGHRERSDLRLTLACACGKQTTTYEFNARKFREQTCRHGKRKRAA